MVKGFGQGMGLERLQKIMASLGVGSRRHCEKLLSAGQVKVNGTVAQLGDKADLACDRVEIAGYGYLNAAEPPKIYIVLNKPRGFVSTVRDQAGRPTVMDLVKDIADRLSKASNGAIQPDDGTLVKIGQFMSRPEYKFERDRCARGWTYWVKVL